MSSEQDAAVLLIICVGIWLVIAAIVIGVGIRQALAEKHDPRTDPRTDDQETPDR